MTVARTIDDVHAALMAERDENICRKEFTPSEAVEMAKALEPFERQEAKKRQADHGSTAPGKAKQENTSGKFTEVIVGDSRDRIAAAVGMSAPTLAKARVVGAKIVALR